MPESDHLTLLHVYQQWKTNGYRADWCSQHFLQHKGLKKAKEVRTQLLDIMQQHKVPVISCGTDWDTVRKVRRHACACVGMQLRRSGWAGAGLGLLGAQMLPGAPLSN